MNMKVILAGLATGVASFLLGWVVFGIVMESYYASVMLHHEGLMKDPPNMLALVLGNLIWGGTVAWALWKMNVSSAMGGFLPGAIIGGAFAACFDLFMLAFMMLIKDTTFVIVDVLVNAVVGGILGVVAGMVLGMGQKSTA